MRFTSFAFIIISFSFIVHLSSCDNSKKAPNVILIYTDDLGYGDLSCYGNPTILTPNLDRLAVHGIKYTQFYVSAPVCSPSRASLLTGCYPKRIELHRHVIFPQDDNGINPEETTIAELFKQAGYHTACFGKWHLGNHKSFLPLQNGFDEYFGIPYSNDMSRPEQVKSGNSNYPHHLPLIEGNDTIELDPDQRHFTKMFTEKAVGFIENHSEDHFFIYLAHPMPHIPIYASEDFQGKSLRGLYGDVINEIDWSVGQVVNTLDRLNIRSNTFIFFSSDNGPWLPFKTHGGSAGPLRGGKGSTWEGGMREPCIISWPDGIENQGITDQRVWTNMDLLPTLVSICNLEKPGNKIDGLDLSSWFLAKDEKAVDRPFYYYTSRGDIQGIRVGAWKYREEEDTAFILNVEEDISEKYNLINLHSAKADSMKKLMYEFDNQLDSEMRSHGKLH